MNKLRTRQVEGSADIRAFFDRLAATYKEAHGRPDRLLAYRLSFIRPLLGKRRGTLLEIGCGTGMHLFELAGLYEQAIGTDLSPNMISEADTLRERHPNRETIRFTVDPAEQLNTIESGQIDTVLCVGAFEHMPDKTRVLRQIARVLKPGGEFICLTPNGAYCWYTAIARRFRWDTRHLSSDRFMTRQELYALLNDAGLAPETIGYWTFIPKGDMPSPIYWLLSGLNIIGERLKIPALRGGIYLKAVCKHGQSKDAYKAE
ncbi:MAG: class I SAM-dependent methyltransferase [Gammaproteobacteria bacterium HGW-Gammaproteobacteria-10]|nr:MAG: class I SAM-dependent methyltransferase [Gammaproteobacteria bacterium HGW-Gammaproteobacteria-10]